MEPQSTTFPGWKVSLRSLVLMALLAGVTTLAWALTIPAGRANRQASALLAEVRQRTLEHYWTQSGPVRRWFLVYLDNELAGWELHYRQSTPDGFAGGQVGWRYHTRPYLHIESQWRLSSDARIGQYQAIVEHVDPRLRGGLRQLFHRTEIRLNDGRIDVTQVTPQGTFQSARAVPDNYIPEGMRSLLTRLIAEKQTRGTFRMVLDDYTPPPGSTTTPLISIDLDFQHDTDDPSGGAEVHENLNIPAKGSTTTILTLDADGRILESRSASHRLAASTPEGVLKHFPQARTVLENLSAD